MSHLSSRNVCRQFTEAREEMSNFYVSFVKQGIQCILWSDASSLQLFSFTIWIANWAIQKEGGWMNEGRYFSINSGALWYLAKPPPYTGAPSWSNSRGSPVKFLQLLSEFCSVHAAPRQIFTTLKNIFSTLSVVG